MISRRPLGASPTLGRVVALIVVLFLARSLVTFPIEHIDAAFKYLAAADIVRGQGLDRMLQIHHTMRWSEMLPQVFVTWITGFRYEGLYLLPLLAFATYCAVFWRGLAPLLGVGQQGLLLALLFLEPIALQHTGQLLNPPFGVLYAVLAVAVLAGAERLSWSRAFAATFLFFAAYGAHSTYLAFFGGGVAWVLLRRRPGAAAFMVVAMGLLMALESLLFAQLATDSAPGGRLGALADGGHFRSLYWRYPPVEAHELFTRWLDLPVFDLVLTAGFAACFAQLTFSRSARAEAPAFVQLCLLVGAAYAVAITFAVVSLDPIRPMMPLYTMYLEPFLPFAVVGTVTFLAGLENRLRRPTRRWLEGGAVAVMALFLALAASQKGTWDRLVNYRLNAFMWKSHGEMTTLGERFRRGDIMLVGRNRIAIEKLIRYHRQSTVLYHNEMPYIASAPRVSRDVQCVRGIRYIPLERNDRRCTRKQLRAARAAGVRWRRPGGARGDDSL